MTGTYLDGMPLPAGSHRFETMSDKVIKVLVSMVAVATSAMSLFATSWIGLALLGF